MMDPGLLPTHDGPEDVSTIREPVASSAVEERRRRRGEAIDRLLAEFAPSEDKDLLSQMIVTVCRLAADHADRGDLKILNTALKELRYAFKVFAPFTETPKVTIFGSARTPEDHPEYEEARKFADLIQHQGWMVITGAGDGIMRAGHHGATRQRSFGVAISLPFEQATNTIIEDDAKLVNFKYFFTRKLMFMKEARAVVLFPGGFGTQDECFEALTLVQTAKTVPIPIVMCDAPGGKYWRRWAEYVKNELLGHRMIDSGDQGLFRVCDRAEDAVAEIVRFYRMYHSIRYVDDVLVLRMNRALSPAAVEGLNKDFADIIKHGRIEQRVGPIEGEDGCFPDLPRLVFSFDRRSTGRLRRLIDTINDGAA